MISLDSNILVYAADATAGERHTAAVGLVERAMRSGACVQTLQSFSEFFNVVTRKAGVEPAAATELISAWGAAMTVEPPSLPDLHSAMRATAEHRLSFWDAMLWATARRVGVTVLFSEDFQDGRTIEGVLILNPFAERNAAALDNIFPLR